MLTMKKKMATATTHTELMSSNIGVLNPRIGSTCPEMMPRERSTMWVSGRMDTAIPCAAVGRRERGKNVPHKKNMGVRNRNEG